VAVALLANESLYHESSEPCETAGDGTLKARRPSLRAVKHAGASKGKEKASLFGEFFFPV
jgi:hypothetical protein